MVDTAAVHIYADSVLILIRGGRKVRYTRRRWRKELDKTTTRDDSVRYIVRDSIELKTN
jgi:hypothetical protein